MFGGRSCAKLDGNILDLVRRVVKPSSNEAREMGIGGPQLESTFAKTACIATVSARSVLISCL
jgi:hypothetical protein